MHTEAHQGSCVAAHAQTDAEIQWNSLDLCLPVPSNLQVELKMPTVHSHMTTDQ